MIFNYYKIYNKITDTAYLGITERNYNKRWKEHIQLLNSNKHPNYLLQKDWNDFGQESFIFELIEQLDENLEKGYEHEHELIKNYNGKKYNLSEGGMVNPMYTPSIKEKMIKTKQKVVPNVYQLKEIDENVFKIINVYNSQKEAGRLSGASQGNIQHAIHKHRKTNGCYWITENMIDTFEKEWKPARTKISPCAEVDDNNNIIEIHYNKAIFQKAYGLPVSGIINAIKRNGRTGGRKFINLTVDEYYTLKPVTLIK